MESQPYFHINKTFLHALITDNKRIEPLVIDYRRLCSIYE